MHHLKTSQQVITIIAFSAQITLYQLQYELIDDCQTFFLERLIDLGIVTIFLHQSVMIQNYFQTLKLIKLDRTSINYFCLLEQIMAQVVEINGKQDQIQYQTSDPHLEKKNSWRAQETLSHLNKVEVHSSGPQPNEGFSSTSSEPMIPLKDNHLQVEKSSIQKPIALTNIAELLKVLGKKFTIQNQEYVMQIPSLNQLLFSVENSTSLQQFPSNVACTQGELKTDQKIIEQVEKQSSEESFDSESSYTTSGKKSVIDNQFLNKDIQTKAVPIIISQKSVSEVLKKVDNNRLSLGAQQEIVKINLNAQIVKMSSSDSFSSPQTVQPDSAKETLNLDEVCQIQEESTSNPSILDQQNAKKIKLDKKSSIISNIKKTGVSSPQDNNSLESESRKFIDQIQSSKVVKFQTQIKHKEEKINPNEEVKIQMQSDQDQLQTDQEMQQHGPFEPLKMSKTLSNDTYTKIALKVQAELDTKETKRILPKKAKKKTKKNATKASEKQNQLIKVPEADLQQFRDDLKPYNSPKSNQNQPIEITKKLSDQNLYLVSPTQKQSPTGGLNFRQLAHKVSNTKLIEIKEDFRENQQEDVNFDVSEYNFQSDSFRNSDDEQADDDVPQMKFLPFLKRFSTQFGAIRQTDSVDPMIRYIENISSQLKLDSQIFFQEIQSIRTEKNNSGSQEVSLDLSKSYSKKKRKKIEEIQEIQEIQNALNQYKQLNQQQDGDTKEKLSVGCSPDQSLRNQQFLNASQSPLFKQHSSLQILNQLAKKQSKLKSPQFSSEEGKNVGDANIEMLKMKIHTNVISYALRQNFKKLKLKFIKEMNLQRDLINKHEKKVGDFMTKIKRQEKQLHFAFLFACPLVLTCGQINQDKYKLVPQLNHQKEYSKILQRVELSQHQITITKSYCTIETLREILMIKPLGLHFSGHGILNTFESVGEYHNQHKNSGHFLLLETENGDSQLVSRDELEKLLKRTEAKLDFVFVASCHSQFVGEIFLEAGAKHVICINQENDVQDDAVITFTDAFYDLVFSNTVNICQAFLNAQLIVSIKHSHKQAKIFKLLVQEKDHKYMKSCVNTETKGHVCNNFGPFPKGQYKEVNSVEPTLKIGSIDQPPLVGRQKDVFKLIQKIFSQNSSRILTLLGFPGIGKSSLAKQTLQHIDERRLLPGGYIFLNMHGVKESEVFLRVLNNSFTQDNPLFFSIFGNVDSNKSQHDDCLQNISLILRKISALNRKILMVIDNAEDLIDNDKSSFKKLLSFLLSHVKLLTILITSTCRLKDLKEYKEESILLQELSPLQSLTLFISLTRPLNQKEINGLLRVKPDYKRYPSEKGVPEPWKLHEHHFFKLLGGNPSSIVILAPMLMDNERTLDLPGLYKMLCKPRDFQDSKIDDDIFTAIKTTFHISMQQLQENDPECMELLFFLTMLPGGVLPKDLDILWKSYLEKRTNENGKNPPQRKLTDQNNSQIEGEDDYDFNKDCQWQRTFLKLKKRRLIEEKKIQRQQLNDFSKIGHLEQDQSTAKWNWWESTLLILPFFIRKFAETQLTDEFQQTSYAVLSDYFKKEFTKIYQRNKNDQYQMNEDQRNQNTLQTSLQMQKFEENFMAFISRTKDLNFSDDNLNFEDPEVLKVHSSSSRSNSRNSSQTRIEQETNQDQHMNSLSFQKLSKPKAKQSFNILDETINKISHQEKQFEKLRRKLPISEKTEQLSQMTPYERAKHRWQLAFNLVKPRISRIKLVVLKFGNEIESDQSDYAQSEFDDSVGSFLDKNLDGNQLRITSLEEPSKQNLSNNCLNTDEICEQQKKHSSSSFRYKFQLRRLDTLHKQNLFKRKFTLPLVLSQAKTQFNSKQNGRLSYQDWLEEHMPDNELSIVYFITNLILQDQFTTAESIIAKSLLTLQSFSQTFHGNIRRLQGLCQFELYKISFSQTRQDKHCSKKTLEQKDKREKISQIKKCLNKALTYFSKNSDNLWGIALTNFQFAQLIYFLHSEKLNERSCEMVITSKNVVKGFNDSKNQTGSHKNYDQAIEMLQVAQANFQQMCHYRGLAQTIKLMIDFENLKIHEIDMMLHHSVSQNKPSKSSFSSYANILKSNSGKNNETQEDFRDQTAKIKDFESKFSESMRNYRSKKSLLQIGDVRLELFISRQQGETFSLLTEIVRGIPDHKGVFSKELSIRESDSQESSSASESFKSDKSGFTEDNTIYPSFEENKKVQVPLNSNKKKLLTVELDIYSPQKESKNMKQQQEPKPMLKKASAMFKKTSVMQKMKSEYPNKQKKVNFANVEAMKKFSAAKKKEKSKESLHQSLYSPDSLTSPGLKHPEIPSIDVESDRDINETPESLEQSPLNEMISSVSSVPSSLQRKVQSSMKPSSQRQKLNSSQSVKK